jgi:hypothetical protein
LLINLKNLELFSQKEILVFQNIQSTNLNSQMKNQSADTSDSNDSNDFSLPYQGFGFELQTIE